MSKPAEGSVLDLQLADPAVKESVSKPMIRRKKDYHKSESVSGRMASKG
jgi:hypothetical protein